MGTDRINQLGFLVQNITCSEGYEEPVRNPVV